MNDTTVAMLLVAGFLFLIAFLLIYVMSNLIKQQHQATDERIDNLIHALRGAIDHLNRRVDELCGSRDLHARNANAALRGAQESRRVMDGFTRRIEAMEKRLSDK